MAAGALRHRERAQHVQPGGVGVLGESLDDDHDQATAVLRLPAADVAAVDDTADVPTPDDADDTTRVDAMSTVGPRANPLATRR